MAESPFQRPERGRSGPLAMEPAARLTDAVDTRKLFFDVEVREGDRTIGVGSHQRRVIQTDG